MNIAKAIALKIVSALMFAAMSALVRYLGPFTPVGEIVFFRSAFAIVPVVMIYAWRRELRAMIYTHRPIGHIGRGFIGMSGMFFNFASLARLPLGDATAISFAAPLITVALAAIVLKERVRAYRWTAVFVGLFGVLVMMIPYVDLGRTLSGRQVETTIGALAGLTGAFFNAAAVIQTRRLTNTETTPCIVFYFSVICAVGGLLTVPFGWYSPTPLEFLALMSIGFLGGLAHIVLTESYRYAPASLVAPFDYMALLWAFLLGYFFFDEVPTVIVFAGAAIVIAAGLFVIWRERQLGLERKRAAELPPPGS